MYPGIFYKLISSLLLIAILNLTCVETLYAMQRDADAHSDTEDGSDRSHLLRQRHLPLDDPSRATSVSLPVSPKPTLLDVVTDDEEATRELRDYVASLPAGVRAELRTFEHLQEYVYKLGPTGTTIKWTLAVINGGLQAAGTANMFFSPGMGGMLNALPESPTSPPNPRMIGYSALGGTVTLPDTILGTENTMMVLLHAFQDKRLLKYMKKKGATHVVIRGTADGIGTTVLVTMSMKAFYDVAVAGGVVYPVLFVILGIEYCVHQVSQSAQIIDGSVVKKMRYVRDHTAPAEVRTARKELDRRVMSAFRMSIMEREYAREKMEELKGLRAYVAQAVAELDAMRDEFASPEAYLAAKHTLQEFEVLAELDAVLRNFNPDHKYEPPPHKTRWWESIPFIGRLIGPYSTTYKVVYALFGAFAAVGSYITDYGYAWVFGGGGFGAATATAYGLATPLTVLFTLYFMDQLGQGFANVVSSALAHNNAMDVNGIDQTQVGAQSRMGRVGRTIIDFVGLGMAGFKTLFKTASAATGAGNLLGNTPADHATQMPGIVALAASNGAADHLNTGTRVQQALSRIVEYKHGAGAQALTDYIARLRGAFADMNNEEVPELLAALDGFHDLSERLIADYERRRQEAGVAAPAEQRSVPASEASGEVREPSPSGHDTAALPEALRTGEGAAAEASHRRTPPPLQPAQQAGAQRRARQQESAAVEMSVIRQLRQPLMEAEHRQAPAPAQGMVSRMASGVRRMVSAVWSKVTLTRAPVVAPLVDV